MHEIDFIMFLLQDVTHFCRTVLMTFNFYIHKGGKNYFQCRKLDRADLTLNCSIEMFSEMFTR